MQLILIIIILIIIKMKIRKDRLAEIIRETLNEFLSEGASLCHDSKGHFTDCDAGSTYSLSQSGAKRAGVDKKYVSRGTVTKKVKRPDGTYVVRSKMGLNTSDSEKQGGRAKFPKGKPISPKRYVSKYPKQYYKEEKTKWDPKWPSARKRKSDHEILKPSHSSWLHGNEELSKLARSVGIVENGINFTVEDILEIVSSAFPATGVSEGNSAILSQCKKAGLVTISDAQERILRSLNSFAKAADGKLFDTGKD